MKIKKLKLENFTVFDNIVLDFDEGLNVFIGENGTGKTHIMKLLYSACQAVNPKVSFSRKLVGAMLPDDYSIGRLVSKRQGNNNTRIGITALSEKNGAKRSLSADFTKKTKKWDASVKGEETWEKEFEGISSIFIPAKEILSNSYNLISAAEKDNVRFDDTYIDIINSAKVDISTDIDSDERRSRLDRIEKIIDGKVEYDANRDEFYLKKGNSKTEFNLAAEGIRKMALIWQLVKNGALEKDSVLFWDEPEANINPKYVSVIVDLLLELAGGGVQVFVSTHDYMLAKYFEIRKSKNDTVLFHSLSLNENGVTAGSSVSFGNLDNVIINSFERLLDEVYNTEVNRNGNG